MRPAGTSGVRHEARDIDDRIDECAEAVVDAGCDPVDPPQVVALRQFSPYPQVVVTMEVGVLLKPAPAVMRVWFGKAGMSLRACATAMGVARYAHRHRRATAGGDAISAKHGERADSWLQSGLVGRYTAASASLSPRPPHSYSAASTLRGGVCTTGTRSGALNDDARRSLDTGR
jgi:hypothetical protein